MAVGSCSYTAVCPWTAYSDTASETWRCCESVTSAPSSSTSTKLGLRGQVLRDTAADWLVLLDADESTRFMRWIAQPSTPSKSPRHIDLSNPDTSRSSTCLKRWFAEA
jgi:hypothetical protein